MASLSLGAWAASSTASSFRCCISIRLSGTRKWGGSGAQACRVKVSGVRRTLNQGNAVVQRAKSVAERPRTSALLEKLMTDLLDFRFDGQIVEGRNGKRQKQADPAVQ